MDNSTNVDDSIETRQPEADIAPSDMVLVLRKEEQDAIQEASTEGSQANLVLTSSGSTMKDGQEPSIETPELLAVEAPELPYIEPSPREELVMDKCEDPTVEGSIMGQEQELDMGGNQGPTGEEYRNPTAGEHPITGENPIAGEYPIAGECQESAIEPQLSEELSSDHDTDCEGEQDIAFLEDNHVQTSSLGDDLPLFVRGDTPDIEAMQPAPTQMPPPPLPTAAPRPSSEGISTYQKLRNFQKMVQRKRAAKRPAPHQHQAEPDRESYPEAIQPAPTETHMKKAEKVDDMEDDNKATAEFRKLKKHYDNLRKNNGKLSFTQDIEWIKVQNSEQARIKKRKREQRLAHTEQNGEGEPDLFPEASDESDTGDSDLNQGRDGQAQPGSRKRHKPELPQKGHKQISIVEAERQSMMVALDANTDMPKKKSKQPDSGNPQDAGNSTAKKRPKAKVSKAQKPKTAGRKAAKETRKTAGAKRKTQNAINQVSSLFASNVFEQQASQDAPDQPTFKSRNKQSALKELIASVPMEDRKMARSEMSALLAATTDFDGRGSARADGNGMWRVKGMKTSLKPYQLLGSAFMRRRENAVEEPRGGLVAELSPSSLFRLL